MPFVLQTISSYDTLIRNYCSRQECYYIVISVGFIAGLFHWILIIFPMEFDENFSERLGTIKVHLILWHVIDFEFNLVLIRFSSRLSATAVSHAKIQPRNPQGTSLRQIFLPFSSFNLHVQLMTSGLFWLNPQAHTALYSVVWFLLVVHFIPCLALALFFRTLRNESLAYHFS